MINDRAMQYAKQVTNGEIVAGKHVINACNRFLNDLKRQDTKEFPYSYDSKQAEKVISFIEMLPARDGSPLKLELFQCFILANLYGWTNEKGNRKYKNVTLSMARKSGKSFLLSCIAIAELLLQPEPKRGKEILFTANNSSQAFEPFSVMQDQLKDAFRKSPAIRKRIKITNQKIQDLATNSYAKYLATKDSSLDGYLVQLGIIDEYHEAKTSKVLDALKSGATNLNSMVVVISTAGFNLNGPFKQEYDYSIDVASGKIKDESYFSLIYCLDDPDEIANENMWLKANPLASNPKEKEKIYTRIRDDLTKEYAMDNITNSLVKHFNLFTAAGNDSYIQATDWNAGRIEQPEIKGKDIFLGVDLSKSNDLTSVSWLIPLGNNQFFADSHSWIGTKYGLETKEKRDGVPYRAYEKAGLCDITKLESGTIDYDAVYNWIENFISVNELNVKAVAYDPYGFNSLLTKLEKANYPMIEIAQRTAVLNTPTRQFRDDLFNRLIKHNGNKLLAYAVNNSILKIYSQGWQLDKSKNSNRIDPIAALINAYTAAMDYYNQLETQQKHNDYYLSNNYIQSI